MKFKNQQIGISRGPSLFAAVVACFLLCLVFSISGCGGGGKTTVTPASAAGQAEIISPTAEKPAVVAQGSDFALDMTFTPDSQVNASVGAHEYIYLSRAGTTASQTIPIATTNGVVNGNTVRIPPGTPTGIWDLKVVTSSSGYAATAVATGAVAVTTPFQDSFDFVVLTDYHVGDGSVSDMAQMPSATLRASVLSEICSRNYAFALLTGDLNSASYLYPTSYPTARTELEALRGKPLFPVPGNHDMYYLYLSGEIMDGIQYWAKNFGPSKYSFDVANFHFTGFNSYEWDDASRSGFSQQARGIIRQPQFDWIMSDIASAKSRGKQPVLFAHHCPPDSWSAPPACTGTGPDCNFVTASTFHAAIRDAGVKYFICGHLHVSKQTIKDGIKYIYVSTAGGTTSGTIGWGYDIFHAWPDGSLTFNAIEAVHKPASTD